MSVERRGKLKKRAHVALTNKDLMGASREKLVFAT